MQKSGRAFFYIRDDIRAFSSAKSKGGLGGLIRVHYRVGSRSRLQHLLNLYFENTPILETVKFCYTSAVFLSFALSLLYSRIYTFDLTFCCSLCN